MRPTSEQSASAETSVSDAGSDHEREELEEVASDRGNAEDGSGGTTERPDQGCPDEDA